LDALLAAVLLVSVQDFEYAIEGSVSLTSVVWAEVPEMKPSTSV
jgi:hypothetical protein